MRKQLGLLLISLVSMYIITFGSGFMFNKKEVPISIWSLGEWYGIAEIQYGGKNYSTNIKVDFINSRRIMLYISEIPDGEDASELFYGIPFTYEYISPSGLSLISRERAEWNLVKDGSHLIISDIDNAFFNLPVTLTRRPRVDRLLVFLMAVVFIGIYFSKFPKLREDLEEAVDIDQPDWKRKLTNRILTIIAIALTGILGFRMGIFILALVSQHSYFFFFGMPWGQFLILEVGLLLALVGARIIIQVFKTGGSDTKLLLNIGKYCLGMFLVGNATYGILAGMVLWGVFFIRSCSYTGICFLY